MYLNFYLILRYNKLTKKNTAVLRLKQRLVKEVIMTVQIVIGP